MRPLTCNLGYGELEVMGERGALSVPMPGEVLMLMLFVSLNVTPLG